MKIRNETLIPLIGSRASSDAKWAVEMGYKRMAGTSERRPLKNRISMAVATMATLFVAQGFPAALATPSSGGEGDTLAGRPELQSFISEMSAKYGFDTAALAGVFSQVHLKPGIIKAMTRPAETKLWNDYRGMFLNPVRIDGGVKFWQDNAGTLALANQTYGVPEAIIVAIIGVETLYGKHTGSYRVLDALSTLAFDYPRRAEFFRGELEDYLLLTRDEGIDPLSLKGSYAGAMGVAQFMPGSYRRFAVDFDGNGHRDIDGNVMDAIGSVGNYFSVKGWEPGQPIAVRAEVSGERYLELVTLGFNLSRTVDELRDFGVTPKDPLPGDQKVMLIRLETSGEPEYWLGLNNFQVLTQYNRSKYYAMAVYQLSQEIEVARQAVSAKSEPTLP